MSSLDRSGPVRCPPPPSTENSGFRRFYGTGLPVAAFYLRSDSRPVRPATGAAVQEAEGATGVSEGNGVRTGGCEDGGMETVSGQRRAEGISVRERLMDAVYAEVVSGGWAERRMVDIAAAAQVSRQTLYNVFGSKEGLLQAVVVREVHALLDTVMRLLEEEGGDPPHAVSRATRLVLLAARDNPLLRAVVTGDRVLLPVLTTRSELLLGVLGERITQTLMERCPHVDAALAEAAADVALRLTVSYSLQPIDPDQAARRVETVVHGMLLVGG